MNRIYAAVIEIIASAVVIVPLFWIYGKLVFRSIKNTAVYLIFAFYLVAVMALVGFPNVVNIHVEVTINRIPFVGMVSDFKNAILNVALFVPMGIFLPILFRRCREMNGTLLVAFCTTCVIETVQMTTYRTTDINDIITNVAGAWLGYELMKHLTRGFNRYTLKNTKFSDLYLIYMTVAGEMFLVQPFLSLLLWEQIL